MTFSDFNPKVSIVIPVYNGSNYLREAIDSAIAQTYKNVEVIVVNDGSNDGGKTEKIAGSYENRIRYLSKKNGGVASALNKGIRHMSGVYFSWLSHDDVYYPEKIQKHIKYLQERESKNIVTYCDYEFIGEGSNVKRPSSINPKYLENVYLAILSTCIGGCSLLIPKTCFEKVGLFNEQMQMTQDNEMWLRIAKAGFSFEYLPEVLLQSRLHSEQGSRLLRHYHQEEKDQFCIWAISHIGQQINSIYDDVVALLMRKRCYNAYKQLIKSRYGHSRRGEYHGVLKYGTALASYSLMPVSRRLLSMPIVIKLRSMLFSSSRYSERR